jgi:hypothetical protein
MSLCRYKHIFGKEGEGVHSIRFMGIAVVDLTITILVCVGISIYFRLNFILVFIIAIIVGIIVHRAFCVNTTINKAIFGNV